MSKRFTETTKWADPWFRDLSPKLKAFWLYCLDNCDQAGVWKVDFGLASFCIGEKVTKADVMTPFHDRVLFFGVDKMVILKFIQFQYGVLSPDCKMHKPVFASLAKNGVNYDNLKGIDRVSIGFQTLLVKDQDQDKDQDQEKEQERVRTLEADFDAARKAYPGQKNGLKREYQNFSRKAGKDASTIIPLLIPAIEAEKAHKAALRASGKFCPDWAHFQTWINQNRWEQELPKVEATDGTHKPGLKPTRQQQLGAAARELGALLRGIDGQSQGPDHQDVDGREPDPTRGARMDGRAGQGMPTAVEGYPNGYVG